MSTTSKLNTGMEMAYRGLQGLQGLSTAQTGGQRAHAMAETIAGIMQLMT